MKQILVPAIIIFAILPILGQGCQPILNQDTQVTTQDERTAQNINPDPAVTKDETKDTRRPIYEDFTQAKFEAALAAGEPIYLYYWATWCPTCRAQAPINEKVFNSYNGFVHAFRINILDNDVNAEEEAIAKQYNVSRQHTSVLIDKNGSEVKRTIGTRSNTQLINDLELITN